MGTITTLESEVQVLLASKLNMIYLSKVFQTGKSYSVFRMTYFTKNYF